MGKVITTLLLSMMLSSSVNANELFIGVSFNKVEWNSMKPFVRMKFDKPHPNNINKFRANEMHHLYLGVMVYSLGRILDDHTIKVVGEVLVIDDLIQHTLRINTPIHMLNDELGKFKCYRDLTVEFDSIFK